MSVADRLRVESEQALGLLQESHRAVEQQLALALDAQQEKDRELESLRAEHRDVCRKLTELSLQQQQERAELDALRDRVKDMTDCDQRAEGQDSEEGRGEQTQKVVEEKEKPREAEAETEAKNLEKQKEENETNQEADAKVVDPDPEETNGSAQLTGKGVAEGYLRSLAALEKKKNGGLRDPRKIVMLSERSW